MGKELTMAEMCVFCVEGLANTEAVCDVSQAERGKRRSRQRDDEVTLLEKIQCNIFEDNYR